MDFKRDLDNGGADGCVDLQVPDNAGWKGGVLQAAHEWDSSDVPLVFVPVFCTAASIADSFVIAAEVLMENIVPASCLRACGLGASRLISTPGA